MSAYFITGTQKPWSVAWALWLAVFLISDWLSIAAVTKGTCPSSVPRDRPSSDSSSATYWTTTKAHPDGKRQVRGKISEKPSKTGTAFFLISEKQMANLFLK
ncbi:hypothetical protein TGME49_264182 [Toxoplasma gondii ME49]|uniref:Transmembrane protein n=7 Tax=Toxoplasma gondii TaxID=5811 RepID=A0A125YMD3_TOXGV|nr:hypothetical protein TGME49_264182 [Toxoplasma gondii ME49]ESS31766.1 putative transmembrane protein [Toxoplasma gondii VEG]KFG30752.1 putative transmembrane protein [Toxoplasma gondii GAB2-2007-GAL-DOM2]KFG34607.1 putative transmembrane protein [Toxoplasma gondii p89]KYF40866.1 hypothetical protein TGARI_264182 [Toxoplasma gondii ARI]PIL96239.1 putative transmembrane protein [Toxoplasma gondii COUG]|eukprot:XP_018637193.1 hypothetical protein TGME49_264182 [Toxoplasma gondii ME49]